MKKDGIYFGLSEEEYFSEPRIGSTLLRTLIDAPARFWFESFLNPVKKEKTKKCLEQGKIFHKIILEGERGLNADFSIIPNYLHPLSNDYKKWMQNQIRPVVKESDVMDARRVINYLTGQSDCFKKFFTGGYPEVSILWTDDNGIKRAARIDYLKIGQFIDLKSFTDWKSGENTESKFFWKYKVFVQLIDYMHALVAARGLDVVKGNAAQRAFWEQCAEVQEWLPWVCFANREYPQYSLKTFEKKRCPELYKLGESMIDKAIKNLQEYMSKYGATTAWVEEPDPASLQFNDLDFPQLISYEI